jgi:RNA polymerase sigma-70 factor (ECF subfamily)
LRITTREEAGESAGGSRASETSDFESLVRSNAPRMLATARRLLRDEEEARDAVQDAFHSAFRALARFEGRARVSTWLHRIAVNAALIRLRKRARRPELSIDALLPRFDERGRRIDPAEPALCPDGRLLARETRERVRAAIARLPESSRTVLLLRDIEELDTAEVARLLGITTAAVKTRLHRARQALRTLLVLGEGGAQRNNGASHASR